MKAITILTASSILIAASFGTAHAATLDSDSANVTMDVAKFASLTNLDDFVLTTTDPDGSAGAVYTGSDNFNLESNTQVRVSLSGGNMSNGSDSIATSYSIDSSGLIIDTAADSVHNASHSVSAAATLGDISAQKAGGYASVITLTVSSL